MRRGLHAHSAKGPYHTGMKDLVVNRTKRNQRTAARQRVLGALLCLTFYMPVPAILASTLDLQARQQAQLIAEATGWARTTRQLRDGNKIAHPLGVQTLSIETQESKGRVNTPVLNVYQYHYDLMHARLLSVDTINSQVLKSQPINSVHLPLNQTEINHAATLLQTQPAIIQQLRDEQSKRGRKPFTFLSELDVKASIYEPHDSSHACYKQRCALMSLFDDTRTVFSIEPVINLQSEHVGLLNTP